MTDYSLHLKSNPSKRRMVFKFFNYHIFRYSYHSFVFNYFVQIQINPWLNHVIFHLLTIEKPPKRIEWCSPLRHLKDFIVFPNLQTWDRFILSLQIHPHLNRHNLPAIGSLHPFFDSNLSYLDFTFFSHFCLNSACYFYLNLNLNPSYYP